jgi:large subunit ribosomal protein L24
VQTTLLAIAVALILALVAALVGPFFIDWSRYRGQFEASVGRLTGLEFHVAGPIEARLLPTPTLTLTDIEFGRPGEDSRVRARVLHVEFALGPLLRGELRADDAELDGPEFQLALEEGGQLAWPGPAAVSASEEVAIERLSIRNGRATLANRLTGTNLVLEKFEFAGALRSLVGPVKGEGAFETSGVRYPYRFSLSRIADDGSAKLHLNLDATDLGVNADLDGTFSIEGRSPRFEGNIALARPAAGRNADANDSPWRLVSRVKGNGLRAAFDQVELDYGREDRAVRLRGDAQLTLGPQPQLSGAVSCSQLDIDRIFRLPEEVRRRPLDAVRTLTARLGGERLPLPVSLRFDIDALTFAGAAFQRVGGGINVEGDAWALDRLELRGPGLTQLRVSGRFDAARGGPAFRGKAEIDSGNPRALLAWLTDRADLAAVAASSLHVSSDFSFGPDSIAIDRLDAAVDQMKVLGSFAYSHKREDRPARLDATLTTPELDADRLYPLARAILGNGALDWPRQGSLSLKIDHATLQGLEARQSDVKVRIDPDGLDIERLTIADLSGMALAVNGRIDTRGQSPRGTVALNLDAHSLDGVARLTDRFAPRAAEELRRRGGGLVPLVLHGSLAFEPAAIGAGGAAGFGRFSLDGRAGKYLASLQGDAAAGDRFKLDDPATFAALRVSLSGDVRADSGSALAELLGLDKVIVAEDRPGALTLAAKGPLGGELEVGGRLSAGDLGISVKGTLQVLGQANPAAALTLDISNAQLRSPRPAAPGKGAEHLPASGSLSLVLSEGKLRLGEVTGTIAGSTVGGQLTVDTQEQPISFEGDLRVSAMDVSAAIGTAAGLPAAEDTGPAASAWRAEPFERSARGGRGRIAVKVARLSLAPNLAASEVEGVLHFNESQLALQLVDGRLAGGHINGELALLQEDAGLLARFRGKLIDANAAELLPGSGAVAGRLAVNLSIEGAGLSPAALVGALRGEGRISLVEGRLARLNPAAFDSVIHAVDRGVPIEAARVSRLAESALAAAALPVRRAEAAISIDGGRATISANPMLEAPGIELAVNGSANLAQGTMEARLVMSALSADAVGTAGPELVIGLKGPVTSPARSLDASAFASWLSLRAAEQQSKKLDVLSDETQRQGGPLSNQLPSPAVPQPRRAGLRSRHIRRGIRMQRAWSRRGVSCRGPLPTGARVDARRRALGLRSGPPHAIAASGALGGRPGSAAAVALRCRVSPDELENLNE